MDNEEFESLIQAYRAGQITQEFIFTKIFTAVSKQFYIYGFSDEDKAMTTLSTHHQRIITAIEKYQDQESCFAAYIATTVRYLARSLQREQRNLNQRELAIKEIERWNLRDRAHNSLTDQALFLTDGACGLYKLDFAHKPAVKNNVHTVNNENVFVLNKRVLTSRVLLLYIKCAWDASPEKTAALASAAHVRVAELEAVMIEAEKELATARKRFMRFMGARNRAWARICTYNEMLRASPTKQLDIVHEERAQRARDLFEKACFRLRHFKYSLSNAQVAKILGIPKGTVDSAMYYFKHKSKNLQINLRRLEK